jgi:hypothetical protein
MDGFFVCIVVVGRETGGWWIGFIHQRHQEKGFGAGADGKIYPIKIGWLGAFGLISLLFFEREIEISHAC